MTTTIILLALIVFSIKWAGPQTWLFKIMYGLDVFVSMIVFRDSGITISARAGLELRKDKPKAWARVLGGLLNRLEASHCERAILSDLAKAQIAIQMLT